MQSTSSSSRQAVPVSWWRGDDNFEEAALTALPARGAKVAKRTRQAIDNGSGKNRTKPPARAAGSSRSGTFGGQNRGVGLRLARARPERTQHTIENKESNKSAKREDGYRSEQVRNLQLLLRLAKRRGQESEKRQSGAEAGPDFLVELRRGGQLRRQLYI